MSDLLTAVLQAGWLGKNRNSFLPALKSGMSEFEALADLVYGVGMFTASRMAPSSHDAFICQKG